MPVSPGAVRAHVPTALFSCLMSVLLLEELTWKARLRVAVGVVPGWHRGAEIHKRNLVYSLACTAHGALAHVLWPHKRDTRALGTD